MRRLNFWLPFLSVFIASFLSFQVQLISGKFLLPLFGGAATVWTICLLLGAYALVYFCVYSLDFKRQVVLYFAILVTALFDLQFLTFEDQSLYSSSPSVAVLVYLAKNVGVVYFVLTMTPLLFQQWTL